MDPISIYKQALTGIAQLAPLSILIAALTYLNNLRQARIRREIDEVTALREVFSRLGVKSYLLSWSLIGDSLIAAAVFQIRESIEARLGKSPSAEDIRLLISDQLLFEAIVGKAIRDSKVAEKFQTEALEFGKFKADLRNRVPLVDTALQAIETKLRMLFSLDSFLIFSIRNDPDYKLLKDSTIEKGVMSELHHLLLRASLPKGNGEFTEASKFLQKVSDCVAEADDVTILRLTRYRQSFIRRCKDWLSDQRRRFRDEKKYSKLIQQLKDNAPNEFPLLRLTAEKAIQQRHNKRNAANHLEQSGIYILQVFKNRSNYSSLKEATEIFLKSLFSESLEESETVFTLLYIRAKGVEDPDIDIFLAAITGNLQLLESACNRGGNVNISLSEVFAKHQHLIMGTSKNRSSRRH